MQEDYRGYSIEVTADPGRRIARIRRLDGAKIKQAHDGSIVQVAGIASRLSASRAMEEEEINRC